MHILPIAAVVAVAAPLSSLIVRRFGSKLVAAAGLFAIGGGLAQIAAVSSSTTTYPEVVGGMLLIGLGAGLLMPTATDAVVGSVPRGEAGVGAATNGVSIQVGGALGVAVIGSVLSTRYQHRLGAALQGQPLPLGALHSALGSLGGALEVAAKLPALDASALAQVARSAFMSGAGLALAAGAVLSLCRCADRARRAPRASRRRALHDLRIRAARCDALRRRGWVVGRREAVVYPGAAVVCGRKTSTHE